MSNVNDETLAGNDQTRVGGQPPSAPPPTNEGSDDDGGGRKPWLIALAIVVAGLVVGAGIAIAGGGGNDKEKADSTSTSTSSSSTSTSASTTTATSPSGGGGGGGGGGGQPSDDPAITFSGNKNSPYTCTSPAPGVSTSIPGINFTVSWQTQNTSSVDLSVDGPGLYQSYGGGNGSQSFNYDCSDQTHTFKVTAKGPNGPDATKQLSFTIDDTST